MSSATIKCCGRLFEVGGSCSFAIAGRLNIEVTIYETA